MARASSTTAVACATAPAATVDDCSSRCTACGVAESELGSSLKLCARCGQVKYCGRDCQRSHWRHHKFFCDLKTGNVKIDEENLNELFSFGGGPPDLEVEARVAKYRELRKDSRRIKRDGVSVLFKVATKYGIISSKMHIPNGVPANYWLMEQACMEFDQGTTSLSSGKRGNRKGELAYKLYYDDIVANKSEWMEFLGEPEHSRQLLYTFDILDMLGTVYSERGALKQCEKVLDLAEEVFKLYKKPTDESQAHEKVHYDTLHFQYIINRFNFFMHTKQYNKCVDLCRIQMDIELRNKLRWKDGASLTAMVFILNKKPTAAVINSLTDKEIIKMVMIQAQWEGTIEASLEREEGKKNTALWTCAHCDKVEEAMMQFKACPQCQSVRYCGEDCQKRAWKKHKKNCIASSELS